MKILAMFVTLATFAVAASAEGQGSPLQPGQKLIEAPHLGGFQNTSPATTKVTIKGADGKSRTITVNNGEKPVLAVGDSVTKVDGPAVTFVLPGGDTVTAQSGGSFKVQDDGVKVSVVSTGGSVSVTGANGKTDNLAANTQTVVAKETMGSVDKSDPNAIGTIYTGQNVQQNKNTPAVSGSTP